jgi:hypothetical protein
MDSWHRLLKADPLPWLLDSDNPSVRYFALRDLFDRPRDDPEVVATQKAIMASRPVREILEAQYPQGYWIKPGRGYSPKYRGTIWQLILLADLGATPDEAVENACRYVLDNSLIPEEGLFSATKAETGTIICLNGNLLQSLLRLGHGDDPTVQEVAQTFAERISREGFDCRANSPSRSHQRETWRPCAWGAVKALKAFALIPSQKRSPAMKEAILKGVNLLLSRDLTVADYPSAYGRVSPLWFQFGFPLAYPSDILEAVDVLAQLGYGQDQRLQGAIGLVLARQDEDGRWPLEHTLKRTWTKFGRRGRPSRWVTLRALRMLKRLP